MTRPASAASNNRRSDATDLVAASSPGISSSERSADRGQLLADGISSSETTPAEWLVTLLIATAAAVAFWWPLASGGSLVGSDVTAYYLPQKAFLRDSLLQGEIPLWNNRGEFGYPLVAESQTGLLYPTTVPLLYLSDLTLGYNAQQLLHYIAAVLFCCGYARQIGLRAWPARFAALVFVYGWFPPRICLEWSVITGTWLPAAMCFAEAFLRTRRWLYAALLTLAATVQLLAGHFQLAFVTQLALVMYVPLRLWFGASSRSQTTAITSHRVRLILAGTVLGCIVLAFGMAAVQLLPTWELRKSSARTAASSFDPAVGAIPWWYLSQMMLPWDWYPPEARAAYGNDLNALQPGAPSTNFVEAHLYVGVVPLLLATVGLAAAFRRRARVGASSQVNQPAQDGSETSAIRFIWLTLALLAVIYACGFCMPMTRAWPGFSYFQAPGRFGIVTTLGLAVLAGFGLQSVIGWCNRLTPRRRADSVRPATGSTVRGIAAGGIAAIAAGLLIFGITAVDLWSVSRWVTYTTMLPISPAEFIGESQLRPILAREKQPIRIHGPGRNIPSLLGCSSGPVYLGFGPACYFDPQYALPESADLRRPATEPAIARLRAAGVTHLLLTEPIHGSWPADVVWTGVDPVMNLMMGVGGSSLHLYRLRLAPGRVYWAKPANRAAAGNGAAQGSGAAPDNGAAPGNGAAKGNGAAQGDAKPASPQTAVIKRYTANEVEIVAETSSAGEVVLCDLMSAGWRVTVNGTPAEPVAAEQGTGSGDIVSLFRRVNVPAGQSQIVWTYRPDSFRNGLIVSIVCGLILATAGHVRFWHPKLTRFWPDLPADLR